MFSVHFAMRASTLSVMVIFNAHPPETQGETPVERMYAPPFRDCHEKHVLECHITDKFQLGRHSEASSDAKGFCHSAVSNAVLIHTEISALSCSW